MTDDQVIDWRISGHLEMCPTCWAPMVSPFPPAYRLTVRRDQGLTLLTPHLPDCSEAKGERRGNT